MSIRDVLLEAIAKGLDEDAAIRLVRESIKVWKVSNKRLREYYREAKAGRLGVARY